jgi:hypothetical protein
VIDIDSMPDDWLVENNHEAPYLTLSRYAWIIIANVGINLALSQYLDPEQKSRYAWGSKLGETKASFKGFEMHRVVNTIKKQAQNNIKNKKK